MLIVATCILLSAYSALNNDTVYIFCRRVGQVGCMNQMNLIQNCMGVVEKE